MQVESDRLTKLVQEIVDLSRLQVADTLHEPRARRRHRAPRPRRSTTAGSVAEAKHDRAGASALTGDAQGLRRRGPARHRGPQPGRQRRRLLRRRHPGRGRRSGARTAWSRSTVTDQGQGIPEAEQGRIFERFYRVDAARSRATGGTGLGLAIVKHICANHGGEVTVWSEEGRGSTFTMRLPAAAAPADRRPTFPRLRPLPPSRPAGTSTYERSPDDPHPGRRGRGVVLRPAVLPAAQGGLRGRGRRDRPRRAGGVRPQRGRPGAARPHAARAVRHRGVPRPAAALERSR